MAGHLGRGPARTRPPARAFGGTPLVGVFPADRRPGVFDHVVRWDKPTSIRSLDRQTYRALPAPITIREARVRVPQPGFRTRSIVAVTTLLDPQQATKEDLAALYRERWNAEFDLRSIKSAMQMRELRCQTPELVRKEVWVHLLACNLIHTVMAQAAARHDIPPRSISFTAAMQTLEPFEPLLELGAEDDAAGRLRLCHDLLDAIARHRVADRPDRYEPRAKKRRRNHYGRLTEPRAEIKRTMAKGLTKNRVPFN